MITQDQLARFSPAVSSTDLPSLTQAINDVMDKCGINTLRRTRYFLAQTYFESQGFKHWEENLIYTHADRLCVVWPHRFTMNQAETSKAYAPDYINNAQKLSSLVYANQYGNGNEASGDGYTYRGRGPLGLTFKANYAAASLSLFNDDRLVTNPDSVKEFETGMMTAGWFWTVHHLNNLADSDSFTDCTKIINGSTATVPERMPILNQANAIFV